MADSICSRVDMVAVTLRTEFFIVDRPSQSIAPELGVRDENI